MAATISNMSSSGPENDDTGRPVCAGTSGSGSGSARVGASGVDGVGLEHETPVLDEVTDADAVGKYTGQVKWFQDQVGFGFITVCLGPERGKDVFVHHTGIRPLNSTYRTLRKGEYVNFNLTAGQRGAQAVDVTGIGGGCLMCDVTPRRVGVAASAGPPPPPPLPHSAPAVV